MPDAHVVAVPGGAVHVAHGLLDQVGAIVGRVAPAHRYALVSDANVRSLPFFERVTASLVAAAGRDALVHGEMPAGEQNKTRETWAMLTDRLIEAGCGRDTTIVAIGGGVVGDTAGFVAATFMRGIPLILVPTTLIAMVDASIGGKTGVDTASGKNLVGAFHQPSAVLIDPDALASLPGAQVRAGCAEVLKHGAIADAACFERAARLAARAAAQGEAAGRTWSSTEGVDVIARSVEIKAAVIRDDEREAGPREILNLGHTVGHALERISGWRLPHGEAVAIGMVAECTLGEDLGFTEPGTAMTLAAALRGAGLPTAIPAPTVIDDVLTAMTRDKKARGGRIRIPFLARLGVPLDASRPSRDVDAAVLRAHLNRIR